MNGGVLWLLWLLGMPASCELKIHMTTGSKVNTRLTSNYTRVVLLVDLMVFWMIEMCHHIYFQHGVVCINLGDSWCILFQMPCLTFAGNAEFDRYTNFWARIPRRTKSHSVWREWAKTGSNQRTRDGTKCLPFISLPDLLSKKSSSRKWLMFTLQCYLRHVISRFMTHWE